jgi:hypothetical protein
MNHFREAILQHSPGSPLSPKQQALRKLNDDTTVLTKALNQAQSAIAHALRTVETDYQKRRTAIINRHDDELDHVHS